MIASLLLNAVLASSPDAAGLLMPGQWHGDEVVARDGDAWLALRVHDFGAALVPARLRISAWHDVLLDDAGKASGKEVASNVAGAVLFVRGAGLQPGPVAFVAGPADADTLPDHALRLQDREYRIRTHCVPAPRDAARQTACDLLLEHRGTRQVLATLAAHYPSATGPVQLGDDASPHLIFAGDLDRDGRLDLIFDITDHYNVSRPTLFLSSQAAGGELVRQVAQFESVGC